MNLKFKTGEYKQSSLSRPGAEFSFFNFASCAIKFNCHKYITLNMLA